ncbi:MAG: MFS transporter [Rickettsiales bacterium]
MRKVIFTGSIANSLEWYDFALYANFASILGKKFFPEFEENLALLATLTVFAAGFIMRPFGAILFGIIGDKYGRKVSLSIAILSMSIPTTLVGLLPTYDQIGIIAPVLLCALRLIQGLSLGGALIGSVSYIVEHSKPKYRGFVGSISMFSLCLGFLLGSLAAWISSKYMTQASFEEYGWRLPFLFGIAALIVSYYLAKHAKESPEFDRAKQEGLLVQKPLNKILKKFKFRVFHSIAINSLGSVGFYIFAVFIGKYLEAEKDMSLSEVSLLGTYSMILVMFFVLLAGWLSDKLGKKLWFICTALATIVLIYPIIHILQTGTGTQILLAQFLFGLLVASWIGPEPSLQMSMYPTYVRNTGVSLSYNVGCALFGGTAPVICQYFYDKHSNISFIGLYIICIAALSLIATFKYRENYDF